MILLGRLQVENFKSLKSIDLRFPRQGSVLIEGLNEAGKSSLFESIYFALYGLPLEGVLRDCLRYGTDTCLVRLSLEVDDTGLEVQRMLHRTRPSQAALVVQRPGLEPETVQGVEAVNARVVEELGKLDGSSLLNSCFVEQKKLSKLEDMKSAADRRESILKLLNLEKLAELEEAFKPTRADEQELALAGQRRDLAETQQRLPELDRESEDIERLLRALAVRRDLTTLDEMRLSLANLKSAIQGLWSERRGVEESLQTVEHLRQACQHTQHILAGFAALAPEKRRQEQLQVGIAELDRKGREDLPRLESRQAELLALIQAMEELGRRRGRLEEVAAALSELAALETARSRLRAERERLAADRESRQAEGCRLEADLARLNEEERTLLPRLEAEQRALEKLTQDLEAFQKRQTQAQADITGEERRQEQLRAAIAQLNRKEGEELPRLEDRHAELLGLVQNLEASEQQQRRLEEIATRLRELAAQEEARSRLRRERERLEGDRRDGQATEGQLKVTLAHLEEDEQTRLPQLEGERKALEVLIREIEAGQTGQSQLADTRRESDAVRRRLEEAARLQGRITETEREIGAEEASIKAAGLKVESLRRLGQRFQLADALREWIRLRRSADTLAAGETAYQQELALAEKLRRTLGQTTAELSAANRRTVQWGSLVAVTAMGSAGGVLANVLALALPLALLAVGLGVLTWQAWTRAGRIRTELARVREAVAQQEQLVIRRQAEKEAAQRLGGGIVDLARCERTLDSLGQTAPGSAEAGEALLRQITGGLEGRERAAVAADLQEAEGCLAQIDASHRNRVATVEAWRRQLAEADVSGLERTLTAKEAECAGLSDQLAAGREARRGRLAERNLPEDITRVRQALEGVVQDLAGVRTRLQGKGEAQRQLESVQTQIGAWNKRLQEIQQELGQHEDGALAEESTALTTERGTIGLAVERRRAQLAPALSAHGIPEQSGAARELAGRVKNEIDGLRREIGTGPVLAENLERSRQEVADRRRQIGAEEQALREALARKGLELDSNLVRQALAATTGDLAALRSRLVGRVELARQLEGIQIQIGAWNQRLQEIQQELGQHEDGALADQALVLQNEKTKLESDIERRREELAPGLSRHGLPEEIGVVREMAGRIESAIAGLRREIGERPGLEAELHKCEQTIAERHCQIDAEAEALLALPLRDLTMPEGRDETAYQAFQREALRRQLALDEPRLRRELARLDGELGRVEEKAQDTTRRRSELEASLLAALLGLGAGSEVELHLESVEDSCPVVAQAADEDEEDLKARGLTLVGAIGTLRHRQAQLERQLGLVGVVLDLEDSRADERRIVRKLEVKRRAVQIVTGARTRMMAKVLPNTEHNMRFLLPFLTMGRYHDARITEDHRIEVWDEAAGRYVAKSIFSGGARDQFSLALRLAFALATLPQELGTTPGFLFLDEPLSSFDVERAQALVDLLTNGHIADNFMQIFVISHSRSFDPAAFPYHLRMDGGQVADSNLPLVVEA